MREDAQTIADAKTDAYVKGKALEYIPECINKIRKYANEMKHETDFHVEGVQFIPSIVCELTKVLKEIGYNVIIHNGRGNSQIINIYWRDLTEEEKNPII